MGCRAYNRSRPHEPNMSDRFDQSKDYRNKNPEDGSIYKKWKYALRFIIKIPNRDQQTLHFGQQDG